MTSKAEGKGMDEARKQNEDEKHFSDIATAKFKVSQVKRQHAQKKAFTRWINSKIQTENGSDFIKDLFIDLRDGNNLITLLQSLTGRQVARVNGKLRLHKLNNVQIALDLLTEYKIKLVNIGNTDIVDGIPVPTLGLIWSIIYKFQIQRTLVDVFQTSKEPTSPVNEKDVEKAILDWCCGAVQDYEGVEVKNFSTSWRDGLAFNALIHRYRPNLFIYQSLLSKSPLENLEHAFAIAESSFGVHKLLEPSDFQRQMIDSRLVVLYVSTLYEKLKELEPMKDNTVTLEEIDEIRSYIELELDFLTGCDDFFANAKEIDDCNVAEMAEQYRNLKNFIEELHPHQDKVEELVNQIEKLIASELIAEEEIGPLESSLASLKTLWQATVDRTSLRQERLRELLLDTIKEPIIDADNDLERSKEQLHEFDEDPPDIHLVLEQCQHLQEYIDRLRQLEAKIEAIRTGEEAGDALEVLSDEDEAVVSNFIQEMIDRFVELGESVAEVKMRITYHFYELLIQKLEEVEKVVYSSEKVTSNDLNNNPMPEDLKEKLETYMNLLSELNHIQPEIEDISNLCASMKENMDIDGYEAEEIRRRLASLEDACSDQTEILQALSKHLSMATMERRKYALFELVCVTIDSLTKVWLTTLLHHFDRSGSQLRKNYLSNVKDQPHMFKYRPISIRYDLDISNLHETLTDGSLKDADMMKKVKKKFKSKKGKDSSKQGSETGSVGGSSAASSPLNRTESQLSLQSSQSSAKNSNASEYQGFRKQKLLEDWSAKLGSTFASLELLNEKLGQVTNMVSWSSNSQEIQELEEDFSRTEEVVHMTEDTGKKLLASLGSQDSEVKRDIQRDLDGLLQEWGKLKSQRYSALITRVGNQLEGKEKHIHWKEGFDPIMGWIQEKKKELESIDDLESSIAMLEEASVKFESLYAEINSYQEKIDNVVREGRDMMKQDAESDFVPSIRSDIRLLETSWDMLREQCASVQLNIKEKMAKRLVEEKEFMTEWDETRIKIEDWLSNAESKAALFDKPRDNIIDVEEQVAEHEELVFRLATEEKTINDLLDVGDDLLAKKLKSSENKAKVKSELKGLKKSKAKLNNRLIGQQESLSSYLDHLNRFESEVFEKWAHSCKDVEEKLLSMGETSLSDNLDTVDGVKNCIQVEEDHLSEIEALKPEVENVLKEGNEALESGQLGKLKRQGVRTAMKSLAEVLEGKEQDAIAKLKEIQDELRNMQQKLADQVTEWISNCETFDRWIDSESNRLEDLLKLPTEEVTLDKVLVEEQAIREIQTNADTRSSILETLVKEGNTLKENENVLNDLPEEHETIVQMLSFIQEKWDVLQNDIKEKTSRVIKMVTDMQGELLTVCRSQVDGLESMLKGFGPISDGFETLAKDADNLSELFMMIGQTRANIERFDKYARDLQTSDELPVSAKFEVREANEVLHIRMLSVTTYADERRSLLHERIVDVLTESFVALSDTVGKLEKRCEALTIPENLETEDLVEKNSSLEDILKRLQACEVGLSDIEILGNAADNSMILDTEEPDEIWKEIEARKGFIKQVQMMAREKKSRIYGLMVYSFIQRFEELDKVLTSIEEGHTGKKSSVSDIPTASERIRNNEASLKELDDIQKSGEELTMQVSEITDTQAVAKKDRDELQLKSNKFAGHLSDVITALKLENSSLKQSFVSILKKRLGELRDWLNMVEKRREGDDQIGPDSKTIKKQIVEMNLVEAQCKEKRLVPEIHHDDEMALLCLDEQTIEALKEADHDWCHLHHWIEHRTKLLNETQEAMGNFRQAEIELLDYLREIESQIKTWEPINLEDENAVADRQSLLNDILSGMEDRKDSVQELQKSSDEVLDLIGDDSKMSRSIKSQVADIQNCWNANVRQVIEAKTKMNCAKEKLHNVEEGNSEIRFWLEDAKSILKFYTPDISDDTMEDLKPKLEKKCDELPAMRNKLKTVNLLVHELTDDIDGPAHDAINRDLKSLKKDWVDVTDDLVKKKDMKRKSCCGWCYRRWLLKYRYYN